ncbi:hypothetical protein CI104_07700 [Citrobacter farmeri]|uniref:Uncharacterized protein n=1 Tax=Citrobacter farmeri TaxID=67824 RepID=A0ACA8D4M6_9ENTR|nr:hypothetical protein CI104_07700 [Citrobacter farmeri]
MFFVISVTKYRYIHSLLLAMWQNLFYHSKNQDGLTQQMHARLRFTMHRRTIRQRLTFTF